MSRHVALPAAALLAVAAALFAAFLLEDRELVAGTPTPRPLFEVALVELPPGQELCVAGVTIPDQAEQLRFQVGTFGRPGPALRVRLRGAGYREDLRVPPGFADSATLAVAMRGPGATTLGRVCLDHAGRAPVALAATAEERTRSRPAGTIDGQPVGPDVVLAFYESGRASALSRAPAIVARMGAFRPSFVGAWLLWPLLGLVVVGVPAGLLWAVHRATSA